LRLLRVTVFDYTIYLPSFTSLTPMMRAHHFLLTPRRLLEAAVSPPIPFADARDASPSAQPRDIRSPQAR